MALRDQPYLPLYIQDFLTDEKLIECSAETTGVYIRLICILHKSDDYGKILLKQKDKQSNKQIENFASKITKQMPYTYEVVLRAISELLDEKVMYIDGDYLIQNRMVKDNALSLIRSDAGKKGGNFAKAKVKANDIANTENENEFVNDNDIKSKNAKKQNGEESVEIINYLNELNGTRLRTDTKQTVKLIGQRISEGFTVQELKEIIEYKIAEWKGTEMEKYLQPDTLFNGEKCAKYRNQVQAAKDKGYTAKQIKGKSTKQTQAEMMQDFKAVQERKKSGR